MNSQSRYIFFFLILLLCFVSGCQTYYINENYLKGEWTDFWPQPLTLYNGGDAITIGFHNDSFFYYNKRWADYENFKDTCPTYTGIEYASGRYLITENYIILKGNWTDKTYKTIKQSGCYNNGELEIKFRYNIMDFKRLELLLEDSIYLVRYPTGIKKVTIITKK